MNNYPTVSVLMPAYNHDRFVEDAVKSVWGQTYKSIELIVVDDGSNDNTYIKLNQLKKRSPIPMTVKKQNNAGISAALNNAIRNSSGELLAVLASDDLMLKDRIQCQVGFLLRNIDTGILHTSAARIDENGNFISSMRGKFNPAIGTPLRGFLLGKVGVVSPTVMFRRDVINKIGFFEESLPIEDWPFFLKAASAGIKFEYLDEDLTYWRLTSKNAGRRTSIVWRESILVRKKYIVAFSVYDQKLMIKRMYKYELSSALLQGNYRVGIEIFPDLISNKIPLIEIANATFWALCRNIGRLLLPQKAYDNFKAIKGKSEKNGKLKKKFSKHIVSSET
jgi:glycosyltransferase involved in cell wall biosynthesis